MARAAKTPKVTPQAAYQLGAQAYRDGKTLAHNYYKWDEAAQDLAPWWDKGYREERRMLTGK